MGHGVKKLFWIDRKQVQEIESVLASQSEELESNFS